MRTRVPLAAALLVLLTFTAGIAQRPSVARAEASLEHRVIRLVNAVRVRHGLPRLLTSRRLSRAARAHSADMALRRFFAHESSDGTPMSRRVRRYFPARRVGETLAVVRGSRVPAGRVVRMWLVSPPHRAIVLDRSFRRMGVGGRRGAHGSGPATLVTADFAGR